MSGPPWRVKTTRPVPCMCPYCGCQALSRYLYDETQAEVDQQGHIVRTRDEPLYLCPACYHGDHEELINV